MQILQKVPHSAHATSRCMHGDIRCMMTSEDGSSHVWITRKWKRLAPYPRMRNPPQMTPPPHPPLSVSLTLSPCFALQLHITILLSNSVTKAHFELFPKHAITDVMRAGPTQSSWTHLPLRSSASRRMCTCPCMHTGISNASRGTNGFYCARCVHSGDPEERCVTAAPPSFLSPVNACIQRSSVLLLVPSSK